MRILLTGSEGVIGQELYKMLKLDGHRLFCVDKKLPGDAAIDLAEDNLAELVDFDPEMIFHLAASFERSTESYDFFRVNYRDNILASVRLNQLVPMMNNLKCYVFASSYLIYNKDNYMSSNHTLGGSDPIKEDGKIHYSDKDGINPRNLCGSAKLYTEKELEFLAEHGPRNKELNNFCRFISARIFRVYGLGCKSFISRSIRAHLKNETVSVYQPENMFDFIHARDVANALYKLAFSKANGAYNVGTGKCRSIENVIQLIGCKTQPWCYHAINPYEYSCADITKLKEATGWAPQITLEEGIKEIIEYEKSRLNN